MDRGAAAHEKNGANNLAENDRDNQPTQPILKHKQTTKKKSPTWLWRKTNATKSAGRPLPPAALSGMKIYRLRSRFYWEASRFDVKHPRRGLTARFA
jgi:hypothetical protein